VTSLEQLGNAYFESQGNYIQIVIEYVDYLNLGASVSGTGINFINNNIDIVKKYDPEIAEALRKASEVEEIKIQVKQLSELLINYYQEKNSSKKSILGKIEEVTRKIRTIIETGKTLSPIIKFLYNLLCLHLNLDLPNWN
jgi:glutamate synthase domain-containing protein 3